MLAGQVGAVLKVPVRAPTSAKKQRARKTAAKAAASLDDYQFTEIDGELYAVRSMLDLLRIEYGKQAVTALSAEGDEDDLSDDGAHRRAAPAARLMSRPRAFCPPEEPRGWPCLP